jgi:Fe-S-cluster containining protein
MSRTDAPDLDTDPREALELPASENAELCAGCTRCCEAVSIEVDAPRTPREYDQWVWVLHHRGLGIFVERPERWFLNIETRCEKLDARGRCSIHGEHPILCREYDPRSCERRGALTDVVAWFHDAVELEVWLRKTRPSHWKRLVAWRAKRASPPAHGNGHGPGSALAQALVQIGEATRSAHAPAPQDRDRRVVRKRA